MYIQAVGFFFAACVGVPFDNPLIEDAVTVPRLTLGVSTLLARMIGLIILLVYLRFINIAHGRCLSPYQPIILAPSSIWHSIQRSPSILLFKISTSPVKSTEEETVNYAAFGYQLIALWRWFNR